MESSFAANNYMPPFLLGSSSGGKVSQVSELASLARPLNF